MNKNTFPVRVRLADELFNTVVDLPEPAFHVDKVFHGDVYGWLDGLYVAITVEDWEAAQKFWENETT